MLKKRILAIQAAVVLGVSMLAAVTIPAGNIATVEAALERNTTATYNSVEPDHSYDPGILTYKCNGNLKTGDTIKFEIKNAVEPRKNYKDTITWVDDAGKTIYGVRTVDEAATVTAGELVIFEIQKYTKDEGWTVVDSKDYAKYVTLNGDTATLTGTEQFEVTFEKTFNGTVTRTVTDVYEDGKTETDTFSSTGIEEYYDYEKHDFVDGWRKTAYFTVNSPNAEKPDSETQITLRNARYYNAFPDNYSFGLNDVSDEDILEGDTSVITLNPYEPLDKSENISYREYDAATDTVKVIRGTRTIKEKVESKTIEWSVADPYKDYISVSQKGVVKGLKEGYGQAKAALTVVSSFTVTNRWEDGVVEEYTPYELKGGKKETKKTYNPSVFAGVDVYSKDSYFADVYNRTLRLYDGSYEFGAFYKAEDVLVGKGESISVADSWGAYVPVNTSNDPAETSYTYYDANGKIQKIKGTFSYVENNLEIKHEYSSGRENIVKVDEKGNITGIAPGMATVNDKVTIKSKFTLTYKWADGKTQTVTTGDKITTKNLKVKVTVVDADKAVENGAEYTDPVSKGKYIIYTKTKTASFKAPADKNVKKYTIPVKIKANGEEYTVNAIESKAFANLKKLTYVSSKATILYMGDNVFSGAKKLGEVDMTNFRIGRIKEGTFKKAKKLKKLTVNANYLNHVDEDAFEKNVKVTVTAKGKKKGLKGDIADAFKDAGYGKFKVTFKKFKG